MTMDLQDRNFWEGIGIFVLKISVIQGMNLLLFIFSPYYTIHQCYTDYLKCGTVRYRTI